MSSVLFFTVFASVLLMQQTRKKIQGLFSEYQKVETDVSGYVADLLRGSRDVKLYAMEEKVSSRILKKRLGDWQKKLRARYQSHIQYMKNETVGYVAFAFLCAAALWRYMDHHVTVGEIQSYLIAFVTLQGSLTVLFGLSTLRGSAQAGVNRIDAVLRTASTTPDPIAAEMPFPGAVRFYWTTLVLVMRPIGRCSPI